jgi:hypothetical protein
MDGTNSTQYHTTTARHESEFGIKTSVNETKQQSTRVGEESFTMLISIRINSRHIMTSLSSHEQRDQIANLQPLVRNHGLGFGLHSLPKASRPCCRYTVEQVTQAPTIAWLLMAAAGHIKLMAYASKTTISHELGTSVNHKQPPKPSASTPTTPSDQHMPRNDCPLLEMV